jgi:glycine/D-amino acid oxidase-like deaminating enzyme
MTQQYDVIVIGGGPIGLSTAYHASLRKCRVLVLEKYGVLNDNGSSAGASRQFRLQYAQKYMAELSLSSQRYWADLQAHSNRTLIRQDGSLWFGDPSLSSQEGGIAAAETVMDELNIPYTSLNAKEIQSRFAFKNLPDDYRGFFQPNGGIIDLKASEEALYNAAIDSALVDIHEYEDVIGIDASTPGEILVRSTLSSYPCEKLAICTGPYVNQTLKYLDLQLEIMLWQMSSAYFKKTDSNLQLPTWFVFQKPQESALFYGFPEVDWAHGGYLRVATDFPDKTLSNPEDRTFIPSRKSLSIDSQWVEKHMRGLDPKPCFTSTCLIALVAKNQNKELLLDYAPASLTNYKNIVTYTAGWAAKYIPILGDMINQMLASEITDFDYGKYKIPRSNFSIDWQSESRK